MARAHFVTYALDSEGRPISGVSVTVREPDTTTAIAETIYAEDDPSGTTKANPFTADSDGRVEIWLDNPKIVDLLVTKTGYDDITLRAHISQLDPSTLVLKEAGTPLTQRSGINFLAGFALTDDAGNDETEVAPDWGGTGDIADIAASEAAGSTAKVADAGHVHAHPSGLGADLHHAKAHTHDGADGSGTVAHGDLTGAAADDHHAQAHTHDGADSSGTVSHTDLTDLTTGDPHTQYQLESGHTLAQHDTLGLATQAELDTAEAALTTHEADTDGHHTEAHDARQHTYIGCVIDGDAAQQIADATETAVVFNETDVIDTHAFHDPASQNTRITIPAAFDGHYVRLRAWIIFEANATGRREVYYAKNGAQSGDFAITHEPSASAHRVYFESAPLLVATGDYFEILAFQNSGGPLDVQDPKAELQVLGV